VLEKQFENLFHKAARREGITGNNLLILLEARLDNTVYRLGVGPTRRAARQLVLHNHITVNGSLVNIPSYSLKPGDIIAVREKSKSLEAITDSLSSRTSKKYTWLEWDGSSMAGKFVTYPERDQIPENIQEQLIVELYSK
jgi:small subunit ribosomal protein S4